jgi:hypothetical protein
MCIKVIRRNDPYHALLIASGTFRLWLGVAGLLLYKIATLNVSLLG